MRSPPLCVLCDPRVSSGWHWSIFSNRFRPFGCTPPLSSSIWSRTYRYSSHAIRCNEGQTMLDVIRPIQNISINIILAIAPIGVRGVVGILEHCYCCVPAGTGCGSLRRLTLEQAYPELFNKHYPSFWAPEGPKCACHLIVKTNTNRDKNVQVVSLFERPPVPHVASKSRK